MPVAGAVLGAAGYILRVEPQWLELTRHAIPTRWIPPGERLRILHLSDLHASPAVPFEWIEAAFLIGLAERPDVICLTGDYITTATECDFEQYRRLLSILPLATPTFASVGNHDGGRWSEARLGRATSERVRELLSDAGVQVLQNRWVEASIAGQTLHLVGLADLWTREFDSRSAFHRLPRNAECLRLVLSHNPDTKAILQYYSWELMLAGHTHGGQVRVPFLGAPILPIDDRSTSAGLYQWQGRRLYITRGVGGVFGAIRFNCRPEVTILDLVHGESPTEMTESRPRARN